MDKEYKELCVKFIKGLKNDDVMDVVAVHDFIRRNTNNARELLIFLKEEGILSPTRVDIMKDIYSITNKNILAKDVEEYQKKYASKMEEEKAFYSEDGVESGVSSSMFNVPRKALDYIERDVQGQLEELIKVPTTSGTETLYYAIVGEQGTGKTQISQNYCHKFRSKFKLVRFISGDGPAVFRNDMQECMTAFSISYEKLGYDAGLKQLKKRMTELGSFLILVDNFEGMEVQDILDLFPSSGGVILFTAIKDDGFIVDITLQMKPYSSKEYVAVFRKILGSNINNIMLTEISDMLGYNPHAISVCAWYLKEEISESDDPKKDIEDNMHALINELKNKVRKITVKKMYERSLNKVKEKGADVWNLLCKISILNPNGVSKELVRGVLMGPGSSTSLVKCVGTIKRLGLVQGSDDYVMHRLMQTVIQDAMKEGEVMFKTVLEETIENLYNAWDDGFEYQIDKWPLFEEIGENVEYLWKYVDKTIDIDKRGMLLSVNSGYLEYIAKVKGDHLTTISKYQDLHPKHEPEMLERYKLNYGIVKGYDLEWSGKKDEAIEHYKSMIASIDDLNHLDKGRLYRELGEIFRAMNDLNSTLDMRSRSLEQFRLHYGGSEVNHWIAQVYNDIGICYDDKGEYDKAIEYYNNVLKIEQQIREFDGSTKDTPLVAGAHCNIGVCYGKQGNNVKALEQYNTDLRILQKVYHGDEHSFIADSYFNLASIHNNQGNFAEAKANLEKAYEIYKRLLGEEHSDTAKALNGIDKCNHNILLYIYPNVVQMVEIHLFGAVVNYFVEE